MTSESERRFMRLVAAGRGVEEGVSVVDEAEEHREGLFRLDEAWGMVGMGHLFLLVEGRL